MKNRAKCKLCQSIIESFHSTDYVTCSCGEISLDGGSDMIVYANDLNNIIRVDDQGNEIMVKVIDKLSSDVKPLDIENSKPSYEELIQILVNMSKNIEDLPSPALTMPISNYDFGSLISLLIMIFKSKT